MKTTAHLYAYKYNELKAYLLATLFILGNLLLPQLCHTIPSGGLIFLPIYFFTLIAGYRYGIFTGLLTAIFSPLCNYWLFGMPTEAMLPIILTKSILLAVAAAVIAKRFRKVSIIALLLVVLCYQFAGTLIEWAMVKNFTVALQDFRIGLPGILIQIIGGYLILSSFSLFKKNRSL